MKIVQIMWEGRGYEDEDLACDFEVARQVLGTGPYWASAHDTGLLLANEEFKRPVLDLVLCETRQGIHTTTQSRVDEGDGVSLTCGIEGERWVQHKDLGTVLKNCLEGNYELVF